MSLFKSAFTISSLTFLSRVLGYVRDVLIASFLGASMLADAFFVAFRLPNFFRQLSAEGALNNAFIPLFTRKLNNDGKQEALKFAEQVFSLMLIILLLLTIFMQIAMPKVMIILAPGFVEYPEKFDSVVLFGRIVFPYLLFISLVALLGGMLNSVQKFSAFAAAPIFLNVCMIGALFFVTPHMQTPAHALSWGIAIAGVVQLLWMVINIYRHGMALKLSKPTVNHDVKRLLRRMVPGIIGGGVTQLNLWINTLIATLLPGAVSYLYYADRLVQFPLAVIGTAIGTVLLPKMSKYMNAQKLTKAIEEQNRALEISLVFIIPAACGLLIVAEPLIKIMFERGAFGPQETVAAAQALVIYSLGLPAFVLIKIFAPSYFANGDTITPVKIAIVCLVLNVLISLSLMTHIGHIALALGTSVSSWVNASLLIMILIRRNQYCVNLSLILRLLKVVLASLIMSGVLLTLKQIELYQADYEFWQVTLSLLCLIIVGIAVFFLCILLFRVYRLKDVKRLLS